MGTWTLIIGVSALKMNGLKPKRPARKLRKVCIVLRSVAEHCVLKTLQGSEVF